MATALLDAQEKAHALFEEVEVQKLIRPGVAETEINESIYALAAADVWHFSLLAQTHCPRRTQHSGTLR